MQSDKNKSHKRKMDMTRDEVNPYSMQTAIELQKTLAPDIPSFVKLICRSHVSGAFWLKIPTDFCKLNLPKEDCSITLVDQNGEEYKTKYIAGAPALSGGWRKFSKEHKLVVGDSLVVQLVEASKFKVHIIRENGFADSEISVLHAIEEEILVEDDNAVEGVSRHSSVFQERDHNDTPQGSVSSPWPLSKEQCAYDTTEISSKDLGGFKLEKATKEFKDVKNFEHFTIVVNGLTIDSEFPKHVRLKYYELCRSQNSFIHENIIQGINLKLIVGTISEIVNVADALRACKLTTSPNDLACWDKSLDAFERLGMNVGFLRLLWLVKAKESKMYNEAVTKRACLEKDMREQEMKLMELYREIQTLKLKAMEHKLKFEGKVNAPW